MTDAGNRDWWRGKWGTRDFLLLVDDPHDPRSKDEIAVAIAGVLRAGEPSREFLRKLAEMIDPTPAAKNPLPYVLKLRRRKGNRPAGPDSPAHGYQRSQIF
jgi:hypothetical protein